jgi:hypothetical protein
VFSARSAPSRATTETNAAALIDRIIIVLIGCIWISIFSHGLNDMDLTFSVLSVKGKKYSLWWRSFDEISNVRLSPKFYAANR